MTMRVLPIGPRTCLVELADLDATLALFDAIRADPVEGVVEIIPAARTLMVRVATGLAADEKLAAEIRARQPAPDTKREVGQVETVEIPMTYDGEDLADVAAYLGPQRGRCHHGPSSNHMAGCLLRVCARVRLYDLR